MELIPHARRLCHPYNVAVIRGRSPGTFTARLYVLVTRWTLRLLHLQLHWLLRGRLRGLAMGTLVFFTRWHPSVFPGFRCGDHGGIHGHYRTHLQERVRSRGIVLGDDGFSQLAERYVLPGRFRVDVDVYHVWRMRFPVVFTDRRWAMISGGILKSEEKY